MECALQREAACDDESRWSAEARAREPHALRSLAPLLAVPGVIWLAGGTPPASSFPFASLSVTLVDGTAISLSPHEARAHPRAESRGL